MLEILITSVSALLTTVSTLLVTVATLLGKVNLSLLWYEQFGCLVSYIIWAL